LVVSCIKVIAFLEARAYFSWTIRRSVGARLITWQG
jgi:hypothetical protein